jgi:hypothetical protein
VRLFIDGVAVIDQWIDQGSTTYRTTLPLDGGPHSLVMEYYESGGGAVARLEQTMLGGPAVDDGYQASYWNTTDAFDPPSIPTTPPDVSRTDETLDFDWGPGSPAVGIAPNRFVAQWTKSVVLSAGVYRFTGGRDDGMRVFLDGTPLLDQWTFGNDTYQVDRVVTGGPHELRVDYFEAGGGARAEFTYERKGDVTDGDDAEYAAEYFANRDLEGTPVLTRTEHGVDFTWGGGSPGDGVPADDFSARWTRMITLDQEGALEFTVTSDDGFRLLVDDQLVMDHWTLQGTTTYTAVRQLGAGEHEIVLEYFEAKGDATARFSFEPTAEPPPPPPPPPDPFAAEYFDNGSLAGAPVVERQDGKIDFDWGGGSPAPGVPANDFSARWTRTKGYDAGRYRFEVTGDDGIRVLLDGETVIDGWFYQPPTTYTAELDLDQGQHTVVVEYFEWGGGAVARFSETPIP